MAAEGPSRVLVTGGAGFIGRWLVRAGLATAGPEFRASRGAAEAAQ
jgi:nucleoside-diphosphate-sugar epimerase